MKYVLIISLALAVLSCKPDAKTTDNQPAKTEKKTVKKNPTLQPKRVSVSGGEVTPLGSSIDKNKLNKKINPKNIDLPLIEALLHKEINKVRKANGLPKFKRHTKLINAAKEQNEYCLRNTELSHYQKSGNKKSLKDRVTFFGGGFDVMAENLIYEGFTVRTVNGVKKEVITPSYQEMAKTLTRNWLNSKDHRENIMSPEVDRVGSAVAYNPKNHAIYATQVFGHLF